MRLLLAVAQEEAVALSAAISRVWNLQADVRQASTEPELLILAATSDVAVVSRAFPAKDLTNALFRIRQANPGLRVVLLVGPRDEEGQRLIDAAIGCGVFDLILANDQSEVNGEEIRQAISGTVVKRYEDVAHLQTKVALPDPVPEQPPESDAVTFTLPQLRPGVNLMARFSRQGENAGPLPPKVQGPQPPRGVVLGVFGASGGSTRTTTAANIAAALAATGLRVSALDLSICAPALAEHLGLRSYAPDRWGVLQRGGNPAVVLVPGGVEGVRVLPGPSLTELQAMGAPSTDVVRRLIAQLRTDDDFIILDTPAAPLDPLTQLAFEEANVAVFVTDASPMGTRRLAQALTGPWSGGSKLKVLVTARLHPEFGRDDEIVARELAARPHLAIADSPQTYWPAAAGSPVSLSNTPDGHAWRKLTTAIAKRTEVGSSA